MEPGRMVHLCTASGSFHARVIAARLGAEGILAQVKGDWAAPYPIDVRVEVLVPADELDAAREVLLFDDLEAPTTSPRPPPSRAARVVAAVVLLLLVATLVGALVDNAL